VDYEQRMSFLKDIKEKAQTDSLKLIDELFSTKEDGRIKLFLTHKVLQARKEHLDVFLKGEYLPLEVSGKFKDHVVAFARRFEDTMAIAIAPRFFTSLVQPGEYPLGEQVWADTQLRLPQGSQSTWRDAITNQTISGSGAIAIGQILQHFPVAQLVS
jgi:(1->4)-alpha-D-glucan 1-alpha-D-glucosylmutase